MLRKNGLFHFRLMPVNVKLSLVLATIASIVVGMPTVETIDNKIDEKDLTTNFSSYQCFTERDKVGLNSSFGQGSIGIQVSYFPSHQIITRIFAIFLHEVLHYNNVHIMPIEYGGDPEEQYYEVNKIINALDGLMKHPEYPNFPMINLGVWTPPMGHGLRPEEVFEAGVSLSPGRFGWFVGPAEENVNMEGLHYSIFQNRFHKFYEHYVMDEDQLKLLTQANEHEHFICPLCKNIRCATLLAEYKKETAFAKQHIIEVKAYLNIIWLGPRFRSEIDRLYANYSKIGPRGENKRFLVLHWNPSDVIDGEHTFKQIQLPRCEESISLWTSYCKYELTPIFKYHSKHIFEDERLMYALRVFWISNKDLVELFSDLNRRRKEEGDISDEIYNDVACDWLRYHPDSYDVWISKEPMTLFIGAIFPIKKNTRGHQNLVRAAKKAVHAVNMNRTILRDYNLNVIVNDGECKADMVMKAFIHFFYMPKLLGVIGPACSETVEPIAGISRHTNMAVISYSAEGPSFLDRQTYPFFYRTIGSNRQYEGVYISLMKAFKWKRVAALTEDGQKYTEYISHMERALKNESMELIINKKFLSDITASEMNKNLIDLKSRHAKIIIADIHNKYAQMALCEAFKLEMTGYQGYVWFLPSWLSKDWGALSAEGNHSCTSQELEKAFEGHFSIMHTSFGNRTSKMQENITVQEWLDSYSASVGNVSEYTAFAYDAVWAFALAADKLLKETKTSIESLRSKNVVNRLTDRIWETDFFGLSGRVRFGEGGSRITNLIVKQWRNNQSVEVGNYKPELVGEGHNLRTEGGKLVLNKTAIVWLFEGEPPDDGTFECSFSALAEFLNTECENATVVFTTLLSLLLVVIISIISFFFWKRRYDKKLRRSAKIMKNFGIDLLSPSASSANTLDKWEVPKENVVINRRLGEGAFGTVYGGEALIGGDAWTAVAVKTLKSGASTEDRLDFLSEAEAMKRFDHKNIVRLLGVCLQSEPIYTIMEFMLYGDLKTYLLARRHLVNESVNEDSDISPKRLTMYAKDVSCGLQYLAEQKYLHRDLACRNCLVNAKRVVKLGDFGMARPMYENDYYRFNRRGILPIRWMSPESLRLGIFSPASDIWAFGVILFEIITFGSTPYQGLNNNQVIDHIKAGNAPSIPHGLKAPLESLIKSCWSKDPKDRPSASDVVEYIGKYPSLLTACLDLPCSSLGMDDSESDELDALPISLNRGSSTNPSSPGAEAHPTSTETAAKYVNYSNDCALATEEDFELSLISATGTEAEASAITPDGYSIMSPLLMLPAAASSTTQQESSL